MGKKKGGKKGKKKGGDDGKAKIVVETTKEMELERASIKANALPVGSRYSTIRRADQIRAEVAKARLKTCMLKAVDTLSLRGLSLEAMPAEFGWNQPPHEAMWAGLTDLDLSNNRLFQTAEVFRALAAALGPHLRRLDVSGNALAGEVPESAGALTGLTKLQAADNQLTAVSEGAAEGWTKLKTLELGRNQVKALPAAARRWSELVTVDLRSNGLLALEDDSCSTWREVEVLKIGGNNLAALPAAALGSWPKLRALYATDNKLAELPRELGACAHLEVLHAGVNTIKDLPSELFGDNGPLENLRELELYRNKVATLPEDFGAGLPKLEQLSLSGNAIKALPPGLARLSSLRELHLANNAKLGKVPEELTALGSSLTYLSLAGCASVKALPAPLVAAWTSLREIDVRSGAKKEKCKLTADWTDAAASRPFLLRGGIPPKKGKKGKK